MKQPKKPTRNQKIIMGKHGLVPDNWMVKEYDGKTMEVINKKSGKKRTLVLV